MSSSQQPKPSLNSQSHENPQPSTSRAEDVEMSSSQVLPSENPRELRKKAEKRGRNEPNQPTAELASVVSLVTARYRKVARANVQRHSANNLRANDYVFGDSISHSQEFSVATMMRTMGLLNGFLITVTYRGIIVVVSQNVEQYLGYKELDLLGKNLLNFTHEEDRDKLRNQLMPVSQYLGAHGELLYPNEPGAQEAVDRALAMEKRNFVIRLRKARRRSEPTQYMTCRMEGVMRRSDKATGYNNPGFKTVLRRTRARSDNPYSSGNDIVFIAVVRPYTQALINESYLEAFRMEYRTRHTIDGLIIHCDSRIAMVSGYTPFEVCGLNAMNFMHRDDVRWVVIALREMYDQQQIYGESCYRLMTKNKQFIYIKTRGYLEVDPDTRTCTSFVCINTVVDNEEGKFLIKEMRKKFSLIASKTVNELLPAVDHEIVVEDHDQLLTSIVNPIHLGPVLLDLVGNLPSPPLAKSAAAVGYPLLYTKTSNSLPIVIIPPTKAKIFRGIDRMYDFIKELRKEPAASFVIGNGDIAGGNQRVSTSIYHNPIPSTSQECKFTIFPNNVAIFSANLSGNKIYMNGNEQITLSENESRRNDLGASGGTGIAGGYRRASTSIYDNPIASSQEALDPVIDAVLNSLNTIELTLPDLIDTLNDDEFSEYMKQFDNDQDDD